MLPEDSDSAPASRPPTTADATFAETLAMTKEAAATISTGASGPPPPASTGDLPGSIGHYRILGKLGEGGMGIVYEAEQQDPRRRVALKVVRGGRFVDEASLRMFRREAETLARLRHPNIGAIYESGRTEDGQHFFAMELVQGENLDAFLAGRPRGLQPQEVRLRLALFQRIADAVHYAHQRGVIHRDLKPSNIVVIRDATNDSSVSTVPGVRVPEVKILDFGLARITEGDVHMTLATEVGVIKGTLPYMAPEQARGRSEAIDVRTDVYALGVILYEMLAGTRPYDVSRSSIIDAVRIICEEPPRSLRTSLGGTRRLDPDIETIVGKALSKDADHRYASAAAMAEDVGRYLANQPILARPPSTVYQLRKFAGRNRALVAGVLATFVVLVAGVLVSSMQALRATRAEALATSRMVRAQSAEALARARRAEAEQARAVAEERRTEAETQKAAAVRERRAAVRARRTAEVARAAEAVQRRAAEASGEQARLEAAKTGAINRFLQEMLSTADPWTTTGGKVTLDAALQRAQASMDASPSSDPEVDYAIRGTLASALAGVGRYPDAEAVLRGGIERLGTRPGASPVMTAGLHRRLGGILLRSSRYDQAEEQFRQALASQALAGAPASDTMAMFQGDVAAALALQGRYAQADSVARGAFAMAARTGLEASLAAPGILRTRAAIESHGRDDDRAADSLLRFSLRLLAQRPGDHGLETSETQAELAQVRVRLGDFAGADSLARAAAIRQGIAGEEGPARAPAAGGVEGAITALEELLAAQQRGMGPEALPVARTWLALGSLDAHALRLGDAQAAFQAGTDILAKQLGPSHPEMAAPLDDYAGVRLLQGRLDEAERLARAALAIRIQFSGGDSRGTEAAQVALADVLRVKHTKQAREEAQALLVAALASATARGGADDPGAVEATRGMERLRDAWARRRSAGNAPAASLRR